MNGREGFMRLRPSRRRSAAPAAACAARLARAPVSPARRAARRCAYALALRAVAQLVCTPSSDDLRSPAARPADRDALAVVTAELDRRIATVLSA